MNMFTTRGKCPFFYALMKVRDSEIIRSLLDAGADARHTDENGNQALHVWEQTAHARNDILRLVPC